MATSARKPEIDVASEAQTGVALPPQPPPMDPVVPSRDALQALLAFSSLHEQIRQRRTREANLNNTSYLSDPSPDEFVLYEVLQLVAERALALTGADGVAIALVQHGEIICRAASGPIAPEIGVRLDPNSGFSGICLRTAEIVRCNDAENDSRVNVNASRKLNARSMIAVPLRGRRSVIGLLEAFSIDAYGFNDSDERSLILLAELILGAMKPEEEERLEELSPVKIWTRPPTALPEGKPQPGEETTVERKAQSETKSQADKKTKAEAEATAETLATPLFPAKPEPTPETQSAIAPEPTAIIQEVASSPREGEFLETESGPAPLPATLFREYERVEIWRPGLAVVIALVTVAMLCASGLWWRLRSKVTPPASATAKTRAAALPPRSANSETDPSLPTSVDLKEQSPVSPEDASHNVLPLVSAVRHWESRDSATVVIDIQDQVQYEVHRLNSPERIYFDLHDTVLGPGLSGQTIEVGDALLIRIRTAQPVPGTSRVVLETNGAPNFSVSLEPDPWRLVAQIRSVSAKTLSRATTDFLVPYGPPQGNKLASTLEPESKQDLQLRARVPHMKIVVDAGHGGWDLGTVGRKGLLEKDLVLEIAQRLGKLLGVRLGSEVIFTRVDDTYIPLERRTEIANQAQADLFVSVHANYSDLPSARGVETYYTNVSAPADFLDIERRENANAAKPSVGIILSGVALKDRTSESRRLAASIERALYGSLARKNPGMRDRGVKEAGFVVLTGTSMPAVLAEVSFVSSPSDERNLESDTYRQQIAEALYKGIARYAASSATFKLASASGKPTGR